MVERVYDGLERHRDEGDVQSSESKAVVSPSAWSRAMTGVDDGYAKKMIVIVVVTVIMIVIVMAVMGW